MSIHDERIHWHEKCEALVGRYAVEREELGQSSGVVVGILRNAFN